MKTRLPMGGGFAGGLAASLGPAFRQMAGANMNKQMAQAQGALTGAQTAEASEKARSLAMTNQSRQNPHAMLDDPVLSEYVQQNPAYANALRAGLSLFGATGEGDVAGMLQDLQRADLTGQAVQHGNAGNLSEQNRLVSAGTGKTYEPYKAVGNTGLVIDGGTGGMTRQAYGETFQNLLDAGLTPGTPEFQNAMLSSTRRGTTVNVGGDSSPGLGKLSTDYGYVLDPVTGRPVVDPGTGLPQAAPVPGSPAARGIRDLEGKAEGAQRQKARAGTTVVQDLQRALDLLPELSNLASDEGVVGGVTRVSQARIPGTVANRITQFTESALSNVGLDTLQTMRENSPTGGALGQVPIQQQQRLEQVLGSLNINQPTEVLEANIKRVMNIYTDIIYGDAVERAQAVESGRMTPEKSAEIDGYYFDLPFDERGRRVNAQNDPAINQTGVSLQGDGMQPQQRQPVRRAVYNGRVIVQYDDGSMEYADGQPF